MVSLNWSHTLADAMGCRELIAAWCLVLAGKEDQVPQLKGFQEDPLASFGASLPAEPYVLADKELKGFRGLTFNIRYIASLLFGPKALSKTICVPEAFIASLRSRAQEELTAGLNEGAIDKTQDGKLPLLSDNDILVAWLSRLFLSSCSKRYVMIKNIFEVRTRLGELFDPNAAYVQNTYLGAFVISRRKHFMSKPLGHAAAEVRKAVSEQTTTKQAHGQAYLMHQSIKKYGNILLFGEPSSDFLAFTNWSRSRFYDEIDFSPAVGGVEDRDEKDPTISATSGKVGYMHCDMRGLGNRGLLLIMGKDTRGDYWISGYFPAKVWRSVEKSFAVL